MAKKFFGEALGSKMTREPIRIDWASSKSLPKNLSFLGPMGAEKMYLEVLHMKSTNKYLLNFQIHFLSSY